MNFEVLHDFIQRGINGFDSVWDPSAFSPLASISPPDLIFSGDPTIKSDILMHWISWFCQSMCNVEISHAQMEKWKIFSLVSRGLKKFDLEYSNEELNSLTTLITNLLFTHLNLINNRKRDRLTHAKKEEIISIQPRDVRCWICRHKFTKSAINRFLGGKDLIDLPYYVDVFTPRGLIERDLLIEVEHKIPFSKGGGDLDDLDNIALSCGWCNRLKSNFLSIYDTSFIPSFYDHPKYGRISVPQPYWVIRKLAYQKKCCEIGCTSSKDLLIQPINPHGSSNPLNLMVKCKKHDDFENKRMVPRATYKQLTSTRSIGFW